MPLPGSSGLLNIRRNSRSTTVCSSLDQALAAGRRIQVVVYGATGYAGAEQGPLEGREALIDKISLELDRIENESAATGI